MLSQNTALWLRQKWIHSGLPKAFVSSAGILNLPITSLPVDNFHDRALWCKSTGINDNMHGWILCRYCATGWFWWKSGLRAVTMWSSSSFTKTVCTISSNPDYHPMMQADPCVSSKAPSLGSKWRTGSALVPYCFLVWGDASSWGVHSPWRRGLTICEQNGKHYQAHFDGKIYKWKHTC